MVAGVLSAVIVIERTTQLPTVIPFCFEDDCYIKPENIGKSWTDAQQMCKKYKSTLPIVNDQHRRRSVVAALYYFRKYDNADIWLGANASDNGSWNW